MRALIVLALLSCFVLAAAGGAYSAAPWEDPCMSCHESATPEVIAKYNESKHAAVGVKCFICHVAKAEDKSAKAHNDFKITAKPSAAYCEGCHMAVVDNFKAGTHGKNSYVAKAVGKKPSTCTGCHDLHSFEIEESLKP